MESTYKGYIKKSVITVAIAYGIYLLYGLATTPYQPKTHQVKVVVNADTVTQQQQPEQPSKPSIIDILPRAYTTGEVHARFREHEFRATNDFKNCQLMVTGIITGIGTVTFSKKPVVTLGIPGTDGGLKFVFEDTNYDNNKVAALNIGDSIIISGKNAEPGAFGGIFLDDSQLMSDMISKKKRQILVVNGGIYDREICRK
ncbi:OB-fold protein [Enterobacter asburiae]|uniref:OB-fold protein n=1 Tax=Enterobacter asburiae TaxID=61645 RepID=UPI002FE6399F